VNEDSKKDKIEDKDYETYFKNVLKGWEINKSRGKLLGERYVQRF
jgi:hypothetical protein